MWITFCKKMEGKWSKKEQNPQRKAENMEEKKKAKKRRITELCTLTKKNVIRLVRQETTSVKKYKGLKSKIEPHIFANFCAKNGTI